MREVWKSVAYWIASALDNGGSLTDFDMLEKQVFDGRALLWLAWDGCEILCAAITSLSKANGRKFCTIVACGGGQIDRWLDLISKIEQYADNEACASVVIQGRCGWSRLLPQYKPIATIMERKL